uniref:Uncharacterized protein n=1 Tax=viral metagenome TaxID=1070528 RepID=A0A6C0BM26_9ZZZZ
MSEGHLLRSLSDIVEIHHPSRSGDDITVLKQSHSLGNQTNSIGC